MRLLLAVVLGGALGYQREHTGKAAGLRTHMLVSLGAALFMLVGVQAKMASADISRIMQGVVTGLGFLGAGTIIKHADEGHVRGLTTASEALGTSTRPPKMDQTRPPVQIEPITIRAINIPRIAWIPPS